MLHTAQEVLSERKEPVDTLTARSGVVPELYTFKICCSKLAKTYIKTP
jgi:hypothetical protein